MDPRLVAFGEKDVSSPGSFLFGLLTEPGQPPNGDPFFYKGHWELSERLDMFLLLLCGTSVTSARRENHPKNRHLPGIL